MTPRFMNLAAALPHGHKCRRVNKCCCSMIEADCIRLVHFTRTRQLPTISMSAPPNEALMGVAQIGRSVKRPLSQQTTNSLSHLSALSSSALWPLFDWHGAHQSRQHLYGSRRRLCAGWPQAVTPEWPRTPPRWQTRE